MISTIHFNYKLCFRAIKINDITAYRFLTMEYRSEVSPLYSFP